jgi:hypothetical protein
MSKHTEIQNQYKGFVAAEQAAKEMNPGEVEVVYKSDETNNHGYDGLFIYNPEKDLITIKPLRQGCDHICIHADDIPALIKALREFFE